MSNLTQKWKSGGLEKNKKYYTTDKLGRSYIKTYNKKGFKGLVHEVLAPVPSYEEWQKLNGGYDWLTLRNKALIEENQKLFSLLFITAKSLQDMADGKIPYTSFGYYAKQILEHIKEQK